MSPLGLLRGLNARQTRLLRRQWNRGSIVEIFVSSTDVRVGATVLKQAHAVFTPPCELRCHNNRASSGVAVPPVRCRVLSDGSSSQIPNWLYCIRGGAGGGRGCSRRCSILGLRNLLRARLQQHPRVQKRPSCLLQCPSRLPRKVRSGQSSPSSASSTSRACAGGSGALLGCSKTNCAASSVPAAGSSACAATSQQLSLLLLQ